MKAVVTQSNPGFFAAYQLRLEGISGYSVEVGYPKRKVSAKIIKRAIYANFGTSRQPKRPFMFEARRKLVALQRREFMASMPYLLTGKMKYTTALKRMGERGRDVIKRQIIYGSYVANAPGTIRQKGFNRPLIETKEMLDATTYMVHRPPLPRR